MRAAASSIASGRPSSRWTISATVGASSSVSAMFGLDACARWMNSAVAPSRANSAIVCGRERSGTGSGKTGKICSTER